MVLVNMGSSLVETKGREGENGRQSGTLEAGRQRGWSSEEEEEEER
jgi:hypothetical protein